MQIHGDELRVQPVKYCEVYSRKALCNYAYPGKVFGPNYLEMLGKRKLFQIVEEAVNYKIPKQNSHF